MHIVTNTYCYVSIFLEECFVSVDELYRKIKKDSENLRHRFQIAKFSKKLFSVTIDIAVYAIEHYEKTHMFNGSDANLHYWNQSRLECSFMLRTRQVIYFRYNVRASSLHQLANAHQCALGRSHTQISRCSICKEDKAFFTISNNKIWHLCLREWSSHAFRSLSEAKHLSQGNYLKIIEHKNFLNIRLNTFKLSWCHFVSAFVYTLIILIIWPH